jgi:methylated-DNA-[protein]-cysteine S-methyltransferase
MKRRTINTEYGNLLLCEEGGKLISLGWSNEKYAETSDLLLKAENELKEYFAGKRKDFDIPLDLSGTEFYKKVWNEIYKIKYGEVITYKDIADKLKSHPRAVGMACGKNPVPIIVPCHRVVAQSGKLNGYSGGDGINTKKKLLNLEGVNV